MSGPLPDPNRRRRNAPTIPTTNLPASGRKGSIPTVPKSLGAAGRAWWRWAWRTPQAAAWGVGMGHERVVERRASLEDDLAALEIVDGLDMLDVFGGDADALKDTVRRLAGLASGRLSIMREMRELDDRLGLSPKAMAALRWTVVADAPAPSVGGSTADDAVANELERRRQDRAKRLGAAG